MGWSEFQRGREGGSCLGLGFIGAMGMRMGGCGGVSGAGRGGKG